MAFPVIICLCINSCFIHICWSVLFPNISFWYRFLSKTRHQQYYQKRLLLICKNIWCLLLSLLICKKIWCLLLSLLIFRTLLLLLIFSLIQVCIFIDSNIQHSWKNKHLTLISPFLGMMLREMTSFCDINYNVIDEWRNNSSFYSYLKILKNTDVAKGFWTKNALFR